MQSASLGCFLCSWAWLAPPTALPLLWCLALLMVQFQICRQRHIFLPQPLNEQVEGKLQVYWLTLVPLPLPKEMLLCKKTAADVNISSWKTCNKYCSSPLMACGVITNSVRASSAFNQEADRVCIWNTTEPQKCLCPCCLWLVFGRGIDGGVWFAPRLWFTA